MARQFREKKLVIASHNQGKVREIQELLAPFGIEVLNGGDLGFDEPEETGATFPENAAIKSRYFAKRTGLPSLSDDSGLVVPALSGAPGIYSARWAGPGKDFSVAMARTERELLEKTGKTSGQPAHFVCALSLTWPDGHTEQFEGKVFGTLTFPPRGGKGFGYDPIFVRDGDTRTFAEMEPEDKAEINHRAHAFRQLVEECFAKGVQRSAPRGR